MVHSPRHRDAASRLPFSLRRPWVVLAVAAAAIAALTILGAHVEGSLKPTSLDVSGTESSEAGQQLQRYFGDSAPFAILLTGPAGAIDEQGPKLVHALRSDPKVTTISPWDKGSVGRLRPGPERALVLVDFHVDIETAVDHTVDELNHLLETKVRAPVKATQTGYASLSKAIQDESISSAERGELIALPVLLVVLLLVFRSPVAALIPLIFGAITVLTSRGVLTLVADRLSIDAFALTVSTMMGLALGVDYALLMVSRFREELATGADPAIAAWSTRRTAGRTIVFAGSTLFLSMAVSMFILPGALLISLAGTVIIVVCLSVIVATLVAPPLLKLVGTNVNRWRIGGAPGSHSRVMTMVNLALRRPVIAVLVIGAVVLALAAPTVGLKTGPPSTEQLPTSNQERQDAEAVDAGAGPGWEAPFILAASTSHGPITSEPEFRELARWQQEIAEDPGVQVVVGPSQVRKKVTPLRRATKEVVDQKSKDSPLPELSRLGPKLQRAERGVAQVRAGLLEAAQGAGLLGDGSGRAQHGAATIATALGRAERQGERALDAINRLLRGSDRLSDGQGEAKAGALSIRLGLTHLLKELRPNGLGRARRLRGKLKSAIEADPGLEPLLKPMLVETRSLIEHLAVDRNETRYLRGLTSRLHAGSSKLLAGSNALHAGVKRLNDAAKRVPNGLGRLRTGARRLVRGLGELRGGAESLEGNLGEGSARTEPLQTGLGHASVKVTAGAKDLNGKLDRLNRSSPGLFNSGYYLLSALDGAPRSERRRAASTIDLERGGQAAASLVIPRFTFNTPGSNALYGRLKRDAERFEKTSGLEVGVAGGAAQLSDYDDITRQTIPFVIAAVTFATFLVMVLVLRALLLAAIAVLLNLATVGVAFGVLTLLFNVPDGYPFGGHTYVDAVGATMIFGIIFGLSIDYAVFLLMRMRESHEEHGDNARAINFGLEKTAGVITGAAAIMMAVFIVFAGAPIATVSQLGVGLTIAVLLDATVVRIVLLPAIMLILGDKVWWLPRPLARLLPKIDVEGARISEAG